MGLQDVFSAIGRGLKAAAPYFQPVADHLAAAAGNYKPLINDQAQHQQQREFDLQDQTAQSNQQTQDLNRQLTQKHIDDYESPEDARAAEQKNALQIAAAKRAEPKATTYQQDGKPYLGEVSNGKMTPVTQDATVPNPTQAAGAGMAPPVMHLLKPSATVTQANAPVEAAPTAAQSGLQYGPLVFDPNTQTWGRSVADKQGNPKGFTPAGGVPAAGMQSVSSSSGTQTVQGPNGPMTMPKSSTTTRGKQLPAVPGGGQSPASGAGAPPLVRSPSSAGSPHTATPIVGPDGLPVGRKATGMEINRGDLAKNFNENLDQLEDIMNRRPELFGPAAGRWTEAKQFFGSNDPDVAALDTLGHQLGIVQNSTHGLRSAQGIEQAAHTLMNIHNGVDGLRGAIKAGRNSVQTFLNDAQNPGNTGGAPPAKLPPVPGAANIIRYDNQGNRIQ